MGVVVIEETPLLHSTFWSSITMTPHTIQSLCHWWNNMVKLYSLMLPLSKISYLGFINVITFLKWTMLIHQWWSDWLNVGVVVIEETPILHTTFWSSITLTPHTIQSLRHWRINMVKLYSLMLPLSKISYLGFINVITFLKCTTLIHQYAEWLTQCGCRSSRRNTNSTFHLLELNYYDTTYDSITLPLAN